MKIEGRPRILFGLKPEWKPGTEASARRAGMRAGMQRLDEAELDHHDAVVPLTLQDQAILEARRANGSAIPALFVPAAQRDLCHDKRRFGHFMAQSGFGEHVPRELDANELRAADFPLVVKARHSEYGHRSFIVRDDGELDEHRPALAAGESFLQELIPGDEEYAVHVLLRDGMMVFAAAMHYRMNTANLVKGVHNRPVLRAWLPSAPLKPKKPRPTTGARASRHTSSTAIARTPRWGMPLATPVLASEKAYGAGLWTPRCNQCHSQGLPMIGCWSLPLSGWSSFLHCVNAL